MNNNQDRPNVVFSGVQPTGILHIGNYLGAIQNWVNIAKNKKPQDKVFFSIVDLHAITVLQSPEQLKHSIYKTLATYIACGIEFKKDEVCLFVQSSVWAHSYLAWVLSCNCPIGWLDRMTQFKSKTAENKERECMGLYSYPTLMAADILLYNTTFVPVGEDQIQHIELTRDIAIRMNDKFCKSKKEKLFVIPKYVLNEDTKRIMSLQDGTKKMSKSDEDDSSRINITDSDEQIAKKIKKAKTDTITGIYQAEGRAEVNNLISIFAAFSGLSMDEISKKYQSSQTSVFKNDLTECLTQKLSPIRQKIEELMLNIAYLEEIAKQGADFANEVANAKVKQICEAMGLGILQKP